MKISWIVVFAVCIALSVVILVINKQKSPPVLCIEEPMDNHSDTCSIVSSCSDYDLYDSIHDFMTKQTTYIKTLG